MARVATLRLGNFNSGSISLLQTVTACGYMVAICAHLVSAACEERKLERGREREAACKHLIQGAKGGEFDNGFGGHEIERQY